MPAKSSLGFHSRAPLTTLLDPVAAPDSCLTFDFLPSAKLALPLPLPLASEHAASDARFFFFFVSVAIFDVEASGCSSSSLVAPFRLLLFTCSGCDDEPLAMGSAGTLNTSCSPAELLELVALAAGGGGGVRNGVMGELAVDVSVRR